MKKYILLLVLIGAVAMIFGCKDTKYILREDEEFVDTTVVYFDTVGFYYYYDRLYFQLELFVYSNNENVRFWYDSTLVYDHDDSLIMYDYNSISRSSYGSFDRQLYTMDYPIIPTDDSLRYRVDFRIVEFKGYADTGMVYDTRMDTTFAGYAKYLD